MILAIPKYMISIKVEENRSYEIIIEDPHVFCDVAGNLYSQSLGDSGEIILSVNNKELSLAKNAEIIFNPFALDFNNKKIISAIYGQMSSCAQRELYEETCFINGKIVEYFEKLSKMIPYHMDYSIELDLNGLFKLYKIGIVNDSNLLTETLINYIQLVSDILHIDLFVFIDIKQYLCEEEYFALTERAMYQKVTILNVSGKEKYSIDSEHRYVLDNDLCLIDLN